MDIVISYVNGQDALWLEDYSRFVGGEALEKRFRDWGTLKYLLRGVEKNMPYVRKVHLVVARESQVPEWVDRSKVNVVLHSDIIPTEYLPTFNCNTIELFLHRIPGLSEEFLYFNDDIFPVRFTVPEDFFQDGKPVVMHVRHVFAPNLYKKMARVTDRAARKAAGCSGGIWFVRPQHTVHATRKSTCEEVFDALGPAIYDSLSRVREEKNFLFYIFSDYLYYKGMVTPRRISNRHFSLAAASVRRITAFLFNPTADFVCINDVQMDEAKFQKTKSGLLAAFDAVFPEKSGYEIQ